MKKLLLALFLLALVSCSGMRRDRWVDASTDAHRDSYLYETADPTEIVDISSQTHKEILAEEESKQSFSFKRKLRIITDNLGPNRLIPTFPEFFWDSHINEGRVFTFR